MESLALTLKRQKLKSPIGKTSAEPPKPKRGRGKKTSKTPDDPSANSTAKTPEISFTNIFPANGIFTDNTNPFNLANINTQSFDSKDQITISNISDPPNKPLPQKPQTRKPQAQSNKKSKPLSNKK
jgi:hypothetical protein